jgi:alginate O-acetyltransferase complex protein AlgI
LSLGLTRYTGLPAALTASTPPDILKIIPGLLVIILAALGLAASGRIGKPALITAGLMLLLVFLSLKVPELTLLASRLLRSINLQSTELALGQDLRWLGFSYIAFRLFHTIRDRLTGRLPAVSFSEYMVYIIFFPALTAGPIDRIERFITDLRTPLALTAADLTEAGKRLTVGLFKKFVLADLLAMLALNETRALQVQHAGWAWLFLYCYAFQLLLDFSGYTDIAIGLGRLLGFHLPENFNRPYLKPNLTQFWNNWHMTLTQWFRAYFFNPLTRALRGGEKPLPVPVIILITQVATMLLIGFWHGVTLNFAIWGAWHGFGLFIHNRWSDLTRARFAILPQPVRQVLNAGGAVLTFHFVALGWVFFALPEPALSFQFFAKLIGAV